MYPNTGITLDHENDQHENHHSPQWPGKEAEGRGPSIPEEQKDMKPWPDREVSNPELESFGKD